MSGNLTWRRTTAGNHSVVAVVKNSVGQAVLNLTLYIRSTYTANLSDLDLGNYSRSESVTLRGNVYYEANSFIKTLLGSIVPVKVHVRREGQSSETSLATVTRRDGSFEVTFVAPRTEYGLYRAGATHFFGTPTYQAEWRTLGMRPEPRVVTLKGETIAAFNQSYTNATEVVNDGPGPLTGVWAEVLDKEELTREGIWVTILLNGQDQLRELRPGDKAAVSILVHTTEAWQASLPAVLRSSEGVEASLFIELDIDQISPVLKIDPPYVSTRVLRGGTRLIEFTVTNEGRVAATNLRARLPDNPVVSVFSFGLNSLDGATKNETAGTEGLTLGPNATAALTLRLAPADNFQLGEFSGRYT